ncbi:LysR family transcriptional regulator [Bacteroides zoogleoformans]|uniref:LysR family transcriptional regulator n=1 Tax=Bacteroides zoogleoformans TaxID=28119 RepID=A0ABN5IMH4_9BACE|nr:LysR family transcriptional regulator [Bacteroides zoogleoformans]AVM54085.1 LysR family transcriptional regulator [Bacteroides zoogleoformans]
MEIRYLKSFVTAARLLNFSEAAKETCVTQSTFSQTIKQLEDELGCALFFRNSHEVSLTEAGKELLPYAEKTLHTADDCIRRMEDLRDLKCGTLNIGVTHSFNMVMHETLKDFMRLYPSIYLNIVYKPMTELIEHLMSRELDFVLSFRPQKNFPNIESHILFEDTLSVIVRQDHPWATKSSVTLAELKNYPIALPAKGLQARNVLENIMTEAGSELNVRIEMDEVTPLLRLVRATGIFTILSSSATEDVEDLVYIPIDHKGGRMEGSVQMLKGSYMKAATKEFIRILCETALVKKRITDWLRERC